MEQLNGGGHITMAAAQVKASDAEDVKAMLLDAINEYLNNK
jgi:c-di-AMP phosphodiesterase-like protein